MDNSGVCCPSLEEPKALMKMGLSMVLVGHVNFLLVALIHGAVLRDVSLQRQAQATAYAISHIITLTAGLTGVSAGILGIVLSKNMRSRALTWSLFVVSGVAGLLGTCAAIGLTVCLVKTVANGGRSLLDNCRLPEASSYSSATSECPFDPTRIYSTTVVLWVPLIVMNVVEVAFMGQCFAACTSFLRLPCCPWKQRPHDRARVVTTRASGAPRYTSPQRRPRARGEPSLARQLPEHHELLHASRPHHSTRSAPLPQPPPFTRASLNRSSFWI